MLSFLCCGASLPCLSPGRKRGRRSKESDRSDSSSDSGSDSEEEQDVELGRGGAEQRLLRADSFDELCGGRARSLRGYRFRSIAHKKGWWGRGLYCYVEVTCATSPMPQHGNLRGIAAPTPRHDSLRGSALPESEGITFALMIDELSYGEAVLGVLIDDLDKVARSSPPNAMRQVAASMYIWVNYETSGMRGACSHYAKKSFDVLREGSGEGVVLPEDAATLEVPRPRPQAMEIWCWDDYATRFHLKRSDTLLHELGHLCHGCVCRLSCAGVREAYRAAKESGRYDSVRTLNGTHAKAYGIQNEKEFFASLTVPLFGGYNDYEPFSLEDLPFFDPDSFAAMKELWAMAGDDVEALVAELGQRREHEFAPSNPAWHGTEN